MVAKHNHSLAYRRKRQSERHEIKYLFAIVAFMTLHAAFNNLDEGHNFCNEKRSALRRWSTKLSMHEWRKKRSWRNKIVHGAFLFYFWTFESLFLRYWFMAWKGILIFGEFIVKFWLQKNCTACRFLTSFDVWNLSRWLFLKNSGFKTDQRLSGRGWNLRFNFEF